LGAALGAPPAPHMDSAVARLRHELKTRAREAEIAKALNLTEDEYDKVARAAALLEVGSLRQLESAGPDGTPLLELCVDPSEGVVSQIERAELREHLAHAIQSCRSASGTSWRSTTRKN